jgi:ribosomal protein S18 acetylase RimI-like enzyme
MDFRFTNEYPAARLDEIVHYLLGPRLWIAATSYPDFADWAARAHADLHAERKRALLALAYSDIVGVVVYQQHKQFDDALEIKNLTVRPDQRGRYLASFLVRNTEIEGIREFAVERVVCDAKADNVPIRRFLLQQHYTVVDRADLYRKGAGEDLVYEKKFGTRRSRA